MQNISLFILNADHRLDEQVDVIRRVFDKTLVSVGEVFDLRDVDVVLLNKPDQVIPETGMSGYTPNAHLIYVYVDASRPIDESELFYTLCHELSHAKRYDGPGYGATLFESMIFEGIGVAIEDEMSKGVGSFLSNYCKEKNNEGLLAQSLKYFSSVDFDYFHWFIEESEELPRWTGYRVGYYVVSEYLKKANKKASDILMEDSETFLDFVRDDLGRA